jgi:hypothetical protein
MELAGVSMHLCHRHPRSDPRISLLAGHRSDFSQSSDSSAPTRHITSDGWHYLLITWVPLVLLTAWEGNLISPEPRRAFIVDFGAHARYLFAGPLLLAAEAMCVKVLSQMARRLGGLCLHTDAVQQGFVAAVASTRKLHDALLAALSCVVIAYAVSITALNSVPLSELPMWHQSGTKPEALSFAGWWHVLVSAPCCSC